MLGAFVLHGKRDIFFFKRKKLIETGTLEQYLSFCWLIKLVRQCSLYLLYIEVRASSLSILAPPYPPPANPPVLFFPHPSHINSYILIILTSNNLTVSLISLLPISQSSVISTSYPLPLSNSTCICIYCI